MGLSPHSLAASLLPSGSSATVGFGGYVDSSRLDSSLPTDDSVAFKVCILNSMALFYFNILDELLMGSPNFC